MISIIYNESDYEAANIALKVQSLSQNQSISIYIVPKHYGRSQVAVYQKLNNTKAAIFLACESKTVDKSTYNELMHLKKKGISIKYIVPNRYDIIQLGAIESNVYRYQPNTTTSNHLVSNLSNTIGELSQKKLSQEIAMNKKDTLALIILTALFLLGLSQKPASR